MPRNMSQEEIDKKLPLYYSAVECYEEVEALFGRENVDFTKTITGLETCCHKIENIILGEDNNCDFLVDLFQLKQHALDLIQFIKSDRQKCFNNLDVVKKPCELESTKIPDKEKQDLLRVIEGCVEAPRIKGLQEVAGLWEVKKILSSLVILPKRQPQLFVNRKNFNSILLFGPPGTGKTQLVHALAYEAGALLFSVSVGNIMSPLVGQSEKNIKFLFEYINNKDAFSLLFIDEVDGFCRKRSDSEQEHSRRIKTELLCQMSKMETNSNFFLISATNCPWDIDPAFLRRFQKRIYIPLPDYGERRDLFRIFTKNTALEKTFSTWEHIIQRTEGFSGSDISDLVQQALNFPIVELEDTKIWKNCSDGFYEPVTPADDFNFEDIVCSELNDLPPCSVRARNVQPNDLLSACNNINVTVSKNEMKKYEGFNKK